MIIALRLLIILLVVVALFVAWIYFRQDSMIYFPRPYRPDHLAMVPPRAVKIQYEISCGQQTAWYVPPRSAADPKALPERLWILFGGNGSLALFWSNGVNVSADADAAYVMFDYPGYGHCQGKPSPDAMAESGDALLGAIADHLGVTDETLKAKTTLRLMGHSLGAAVALAFAERNPADRLVLAAPFTTMRAMADRSVSPWLGWLLRHNFDNETALKTLAARQPQPHVILTHGTADDIIPIEMSRKMSAAHPDMIDYIEIKNANHESILDGIEHYMAPELPRGLKSQAEAAKYITQSKVKH